VLGAAHSAQLLLGRLLELFDLKGIEAGGHLQHFRTELFKTKTGRQVTIAAYGKPPAPWGKPAVLLLAGNPSGTERLLDSSQ